MFGVLNVFLKDRYIGQLSHESERNNCGLSGVLDGIRDAHRRGCGL